MLDPTTADYLRCLKRRGVSLGLERIRRLLDLLGNPERRVPCIHIAGTNGKGSVAAMLEAILRNAGRRTGLYTSPHLVRLGERIQVNRHPASDSEILAGIGTIRQAIDQPGGSWQNDGTPSYFEVMTALAFVRFAAAACDISIVEAGLGGRLDATNVVTPELSVITSIGLDHLDILGGSLGAIAAEKSGIIKPGVPVVIGRLPPEAERVVRATAEAKSAPVYAVAERYGPDIESYPRTSLCGECQRVNAASAALAAALLGREWQVTESNITDGLMHVDWPCRWQSFTVGRRRVIIDSSHNAEGAVELDSNLARLRVEAGRPPVVVFGSLGLSRARPLLETICRHAADLRLVVPRQSRACGYDELESAVPSGYRGRIVRDAIERLFPAPDDCGVNVDPETPVVVTGSIYLAGEVLVRIEPSRGPLEHDLQDF